MSYIKCQWFEPAYSDVMSGVIPLTWIETVNDVKVVRWPNTVNAHMYIQNCTKPKDDWKTFIYVKTLSGEGMFCK